MTEEETKKKFIQTLTQRLTTACSVLEVEMIEVMESKPRFCGCYISIDHAIDSLREAHSRYTNYLLDILNSQTN